MLFCSHPFWVGGFWNSRELWEKPWVDPEALLIPSRYVTPTSSKYLYSFKCVCVHYKHVLTHWTCPLSARLLIFQLLIFCPNTVKSASGAGLLHRDFDLFTETCHKLCYGKYALCFQMTGRVKKHRPPLSHHEKLNNWLHTRAGNSRWNS